jgi:hypothetical protein
MPRRSTKVMWWAALQLPFHSQLEPIFGRFFFILAPHNTYLAPDLNRVLLEVWYNTCNKKTIQVFLSGNITQMVFLAGKPGRENHECRFCLSHDTKWEHFEAFLARNITNLIQKFKTNSLAVTLQMTRRRYADGSNHALTSWWRYADRSDDVTWDRC